jgi:hypothetical protein
MVNENDYTKRLRIKNIQLWPNNELFEIEKIYSEKLQKFNIKEAFRPVKFKYSDEKYFQQCVAYILDALYFIPNRYDLGFDLIWRSIDFLTNQLVKEKGITCNNDKEILKVCIPSIWVPFINSSSDLQDCFTRIFNLIPYQTCEYLQKRIFDSYENTKAITRQSKEINRLINFDGGTVHNTKFETIISGLANKYNQQDGEQRRNSTIVLSKIFTQDSIYIDENTTITITLEDRINLLVNGILYTFRNDRAHGTIFSPFKSSKASLKTYAHCHYSFLTAYYLLIILIKERDIQTLRADDLITNINSNLDLFKDFYGRNLKK